MILRSLTYIFPESVNTYSEPADGAGNHLPVNNERRLQMSGKKQKEIKLDELTKEEKMKYEIAEELGLLDRVMADGWRSLSSKETGRIGGLLARRKKSIGQK